MKPQIEETNFYEGICKIINVRFPHAIDQRGIAPEQYSKVN
jgi:hypothetical protein